MSDTKKVTVAEEPATAGETNAAIIIDIGKQKKARVRKLRKGRGRLLTNIEEAIEDLRDQGVVSADAQPVIVVVREKPRRVRGW